MRSVLYARRPSPDAYDPNWLDTELATVAHAIPPTTIRTTTVNTTQRITDRTILVDTTAGPVTVTLLAPSAASVFPLWIKKIDASTSPVTIAGTVDGTLNPVLTAPNLSYTVQSDGVAWWLVSAITGLSLATSESAITIAGVQIGALAQVSGLAPGFNIFTPTLNRNYFLVISGKDAANGSPPLNAFVDTVELNGTVGWVPQGQQNTTLGAPGARTYSNTGGALKVVIANGMTWYLDIQTSRFAP